MFVAATRTVSPSIGNPFASTTRIESSSPNGWSSHGSFGGVAAFLASSRTTTATATAIAGSGATAAFVLSPARAASGGSGDGTHEVIVSTASAAATRTGAEGGIVGEFALRLATPRSVVTAR